MEDGPAPDDEETLRPSEAFNPLLFRALQSVASSLPQPLLPPVLPQPPAPAPPPKEAKVEESVAEEKSTTGVRLGATGKRKPKKAV